MDSENWDRVQSLFLSAADLPPDEQARFLDSACADDAALRTEVASLLESDRKDCRAISQSVESEAAMLLDSHTLIGGRLGAWLVGREIGRGGMAVVYLATRDDDQYQKQVAIKVVKRGMDTVDVLGRFRHERQILANLDHPYIARLMDGGTTPDGRPFFVMDYVEGLPLDAYSRERGLDIKERCRLFLGICEAVSYAHRNLVVHRDLKPGNIFVTKSGTPKLLDFGIAKLLGADPADGITSTVVAQPFTPEYASPEQVRGLAVSTATDIYSLGAVFFELLTGHRAQPLITRTPLEMERAICQTQTIRPSVAAPGLDADLDNIVMMAMRKEPERRYQSVDQLAEDIRRYLDGRAVLARQDSFVYRSRKFLRRRRFEMAGTAVVFASLLAGMLMALSQSRQADVARRAAEKQRQVAEIEGARAESARSAEAAEHRIADLQRDEAVQQGARAEQRLTELITLADRTLFDVHDAIATVPGTLEARRKIVRTTLDYLERLEKDNGLDERMRIVLSGAYHKVAAMQGDPYHPSLGDFPGALGSYRRAEVLLAPVYARKQNDPEVVFRWVEIQAGLAEMIGRGSHPAESIGAYSKLLPIAHRLGQLRPFDVQYASWEAKIHERLAQVLQSPEVEASFQHANQAIALVTELVKRFPNDPGLKEELGVNYAVAAAGIRESGNLAGAAEYYERSIGMSEAALQANPQNVALRHNLIVAYGNYATLLGIPWAANLGRFADARSYCAKSIAQARELVKADPQDRTAKYDLAMALARFGMVEPDPDGVPASLRSLEEALAILEPIVRANPTSVGIAIQLAMAREFAGQRLRQLGQTGAAAKQYLDSLKAVEACAAAGNGTCIVQAVADEEGLARMYAGQGDRAAAVEYANRALVRAQGYLRGDPKSERRIAHLAQAYFELSAVERTFGNRDQARTAAAQAVALWRPLQNSSVRTLHRKALEEAESLLRETAAQAHPAP